MNDRIYHPSDTAFLYLKFNNLTETDLINNVSVKISSTVNDKSINLLNWQVMQQSSMNEYFYQFIIPDVANSGQYQVTYMGYINGKRFNKYESISIINSIKSNQDDSELIKLYGYVYDNNNLPLMHVNVSLNTDDDTTSFMSETNESGYWEAYASIGECKITFELNNYEPLIDFVQINDEFSEIQYRNINLKLLNTVNNGNGSYVVNDRFVLPNGQPLVGLTVNFYKLNDTTLPVAVSITNEIGEWSCNVDPDDYLVKVSGTAFNEPYDRVFQIKLSEDGELTFSDLSTNAIDVIDTQSSGDGIIQFKDMIVDSNGNPIPDVQVNALNPKNTNDLIAQTYSDINGNWELFLNPGNYVIEFYHPRFKTITNNVEVVNDER